MKYPKTIISLLLAIVMISGALFTMQDHEAKSVDAVYAKPESQYMEINGNRVHFLDEGPKDAPAIVLVHGFTASVHTWDAWAKDLSRDHRVIRFDVPGFGLTGPMPEGDIFSADYMANIVEQLTKRLGVEQFSIAGNSMGGYIAWNYAWRYPEKVDHLIVLDPMSYNQPMPLEMALLANTFTAPIAINVTHEMLIENTLNNTYGTEKEVKDETVHLYFEMIMREGNRDSASKIATRIQEINDGGEMHRGISELQVPTMVMWGQDDTVVPYYLIKRWKHDLPQADFVTYKGIGHLPMEEAPRRSVKDLRGFIDRG